MKIEYSECISLIGELLVYRNSNCVYVLYYVVLLFALRYTFDVTAAAVVVAASTDLINSMLRNTTCLHRQHC